MGSRCEESRNSIGERDSKGERGLEVVGSRE